MKQIVRLLISVLFLSLSASVQAGSPVTVTMKLDRNEAALGDSVRAVVTISGQRSRKFKPILHGFKNFDVVQGGTSTRVEMINGKVKSSLELIYFISPEKTGKFILGPFECVINGKKHTSNQAILTVRKTPPPAGQERGPVFLTASLSSRKAYVEQQIFYTLKLYYQFKVSDISLTLPEAEFLSFKQTGDPVEYESVYNREDYRVLEVRYVVTATRQGQYDILPAKMRLTVYEPRRRGSPGFLGFDPFMSNARPINLRSEAASLKVIGLPEEERPTDFSGLVGQFKIEANLKPEKIRVGESATLTVVVSGQGNVNRIPDIMIPELKDIKTYADQPVLDIKTNATGAFGSKTMKWALAPEKKGVYFVPRLYVSFFDINKKQYRTVKTPVLSMKVFAETNQKVVATGPPGYKKPDGIKARQAIEELGHDILPVHTSTRLLTRANRLKTDGFLFWSALFSPVLFYLAVLGGIKLNRKTPNSVASALAKRAAKDFFKQYKPGKSSPADVLSTLKEYLNKRFGLAPGALTSDEAVRVIIARGVTENTAKKFSAALKHLENAVYTGRGHQPVDLVDKDLSNLIKQIEKESR
jgi:hypothetical protein